MNYHTLKREQKENGDYAMQELIDSGMAWKMEGSIGREAMYLLESGACMLPKVSHYDYYGNKIPSRDEIKKGTKGSFQNSVNFYEKYV